MARGCFPGAVLRENLLSALVNPLVDFSGQRGYERQVSVDEVFFHLLVAEQILSIDQGIFSYIEERSLKDNTTLRRAEEVVRRSGKREI